jgi:hypothetical protein
LDRNRFRDGDPIGQRPKDDTPASVIDTVRYQHGFAGQCHVDGSLN